ncbi:MULTISPECIES: M48 family metallopeptidase [Clostridium]|uniref:M48 family metallopeptidase n=1 Tax=Clostridium TaxID=1485 RepID=UPI000826C451|nr:MULTISPECIES: M48 family metallopeptidase [Clostridium]PJI07794.1 peptidase M48 [Clostridium sp. CT7]
MNKKRLNIWFMVFMSVIVFLVKSKCGFQNGFSHMMLADEGIRLRYYKINVILEIIYTVLGILVPILIMITGIHVKLKNFSYRAKKIWLPGICIYAFLFVVVYYLFYLPLDFYSGFINEHIFSISNQSILKWVWNWAISILTSAIFLALILWIPYNLIKRAPKRWWLYTWIAFIPVVIFSYIISPVVIDPLYNNFQPLKDKYIENRIQNLAHRAGIYNCKIYEVNKSVDTKEVNAYMTGFGNTKRIVIWDTAIKNLSERELEFVVAHEMGHYVLRHNAINCIGTLGGLLVILYIIYKIAPYVIRKYGNILKIDDILDVKSFPLIILIIVLCTTVSDPLYNAASRNLEHNADVFAVELTHDNEAGVNMFKKLAVKNLSVMQPDRWYEIWKSTHPSLEERIDFVKDYEPWKENKTLKYGKYINRD